MRPGTAIAVIVLTAAVALLMPSTATQGAPLPLTPQSAANLAGFSVTFRDGAVPISRSSAIEAARAAAGADGFVLRGGQAEATLFRGITGHPRWESSPVPLLLPPPFSPPHPSLPSGSHLDVWIVTFAPVFEPVFGAGTPPPRFRAVYVVIDATRGTGLVAFAASEHRYAAPAVPW